jgi:hypothetical protein
MKTTKHMLNGFLNTVQIIDDQMRFRSKQLDSRDFIPSEDNGLDLKGLVLIGLNLVPPHYRPLLLTL